MLILWQLLATEHRYYHFALRLPGYALEPPLKGQSFSSLNQPISLLL
jgi:hypothetical protein